MALTNIESIVQNINAAAAIVKEWKAAKAVDFEEQKRAASLLRHALSEVWNIDSTSPQQAQDNSRLKNELAIVEDYKKSLHAMLMELRAERATVRHADVAPSATICDATNIEHHYKIPPPKPQHSVPANAEPAHHFVSDLFNSVDANEPVLATPIDSLRKAIGISDKFFFIKNLFNNSEHEYSNAIEALDDRRTLEEAQDVLATLTEHVEANSEAVRQLNNLLVRRYKNVHE
jgi:hypothetical protein